MNPKILIKNGRTIDVYSDGRIYQHSFIGNDGRKWRGKFLKQANDKDGYKLISIGYIKGKSTMCKVHRIIAEAFLLDYNENLQIDHINGSKGDNRIENLRMVSQIENSRAFRTKLKNTSSKYRGVYWNKRHKKWKSDIRVNGVKKFVGQFDKEIDAAKAWNDAAKKYGYLLEALNKI